MDMGKITRTFLDPTLNLLPASLLEKGLFGFELARALTFMGQNLMLLALNEAQRARSPEFRPQLQLFFKDLTKLLRKDALNISQGLYPVEVLKTESIRRFALRTPKIILDSMSVTRRRRQRANQDFDQEAAEYLRDLPDYFRRNFHFQTGGYLTEQSASLYEHQVEILFAGAADAMRRLILPLLRNHFPYSEGEGLHFLEVAAGTGRLTRFVKLVFPKALITVLDLSHPYLKKAQENLSGFHRINYVQGDAAALPFRDAQFDAVYSCFLFHELPIEERRKALSESHRVLKTGGFCGLVDSLQMGDRQDFEWALQQFPVDFHEPFYKNYIQNPMEGLLSNAGFKDVKSDFGFFSKALGARKE